MATVSHTTGALHSPTGEIDLHVEFSDARVDLGPVPMTAAPIVPDYRPGDVQVLTTATAPAMTDRLNELGQDGWRLLGPVQVAAGTDVDGGWNTVYVATVEYGSSF